MPRDIVSGSGVRPSNLLAEIFQMILHRGLCATLQDYTLEKAEWLYPMERVTSGSGRNISPQGVSSPAAYWNPLGIFLKTLMPKNPHGPESLGSCRFWKLPWGFWCTARLNIAMTEQKRLAPFKYITEVTVRLVHAWLPAQAVHHKPWWLGRKQFGWKHASQNAHFKSFKQQTKPKARPMHQSRHNWL